jgi:hypothetical protein
LKSNKITTTLTIMAPINVTDPQAALVRLASLRSGFDISAATSTSESTGAVSSSTNVHHYDPSEVFALAQQVLSKHSSHIRSDLER